MEILRNRKLCRLCLKTECGESCQEIGNVLREVLDVLLIKLNLDISEDRVVCKKCLENLNISFDFKSTCLYTEDCIVPLINPKRKAILDMRTVLMKKRKVKMSNIPSNQRICRLCIKLVVSDCFITLHSAGNDAILIEDMFQKCIPEVNFYTTKDPIICTYCSHALKYYFSFLKSCSATEKKISRYCEVEGIGRTGKIKLNKVLQFVAQETLDKVDDNIRVVKIEGDEFEGEGTGNIGIKKLNLCAEGGKAQTTDTEKNDCDSLEESRSKVVTSGGGNEKLYKCDLCKHQTKYKYNLSKHKLLHKDPSEIHWLKCPLCPYKAKRKAHLQSHLTTHEKPRPEKKIHKCNICMYQAKYECILKKHMRIHGDLPELKKYSCEVCTYKSMNKGDIKEHMRKHQKKALKCGQCSFKTKYKESLKRHVMGHKDPSEVTMYKCGSCTFEVRFKVMLWKHIMQTHMDPAKIVMYNCESCAYKSVLQTELRRHTKTHRLLVYKCSICSFKTKYEGHLKRHILLHKRKRK